MKDDDKIMWALVTTLLIMLVAVIIFAVENYVKTDCLEDVAESLCEEDGRTARWNSVSRYSCLDLDRTSSPAYHFTQEEIDSCE